MVSTKQIVVISSSKPYYSLPDSNKRIGGSGMGDESNQFNADGQGWDS